MQNPAPSHVPGRHVGRTEQMRDDNDPSHRRGPLQHILIPPRPAPLAALRQTTAKAGDGLVAWDEAVDAPRDAR